MFDEETCSKLASKALTDDYRTKIEAEVASRMAQFRPTKAWKRTETLSAKQIYLKDMCAAEVLLYSLHELNVVSTGENTFYLHMYKDNTYTESQWRRQFKSGMPSDDWVLSQPRNGLKGFYEQLLTYLGAVQDMEKEIQKTTIPR
jgi:hypothetical protein